MTTKIFFCGWDEQTGSLKHHLGKFVVYTRTGKDCVAFNDIFFITLAVRKNLEAAIQQIGHNALTLAEVAQEMQNHVESLLAKAPIVEVRYLFKKFVFETGRGNWCFSYFVQTYQKKKNVGKCFEDAFLGEFKKNTIFFSAVLATFPHQVNDFSAVMEKLTGIYETPASIFFLTCFFKSQLKLIFFVSSTIWVICFWFYSFEQNVLQTDSLLFIFWEQRTYR